VCKPQLYGTNIFGRPQLRLEYSRRAEDTLRVPQFQPFTGFGTGQDESGSKDGSGIPATSACYDHTSTLYAQSDMESKREAQGRFLEQLLGDRIHLLNGAGSVTILGGALGGRKSAKSYKSFAMMVARDGIEPPTPAFSVLQ